MKKRTLLLLALTACFSCFNLNASCPPPDEGEPTELPDDTTETQDEQGETGEDGETTETEAPPPTEVPYGTVIYLKME